MNLKNFLQSATACALAAALLSPSATAAAAELGDPSADETAAPAEAAAVSLSDSANVVAAALAEVGYTETAREYTKFGAWYGLPNAYWCDMFVSWCAMKGGVPESRFPWNCSCTSHVEQFKEMGRYQVSPARGGRYVPRQGDVIFFYNNLRYSTGKVCNHTGLVLYVEDGYVYTIEGNALTNRLDYLYTDVLPEIDGALDPLDHVVVNRYPLDAPHIHGYGVPDYDARTPLELEGFVDLGRHSANADIFRYLDSTGVMPATSEHTFSPNHGMTRGEFLTLVMDFFGISAEGMTALPFDDVPLDSPYYSAVMTARAVGLVSGSDDNCFLPDIYISSDDARTIFGRALGCLGLEEIPFPFSEGDYSYLLTPYTIRADIANAFYTLCWQLPLSEPFDGQVLLGDAECPARSLNGICYVPVESLQELVPELEWLEGAGNDVPAAEEEEDIPDEPIPVEEAGEPVSVCNTDRVLPSVAALRHGEETTQINGFLYRGTVYVDLYAAANFLSAELECTEEELPEAVPEEVPEHEETAEESPEGEAQEEPAESTVTVLKLVV